jgi:nitrate reductase NapE component
MLVWVSFGGGEDTDGDRDSAEAPSQENRAGNQLLQLVMLLGIVPLVAVFSGGWSLLVLLYVA